LDGGNVSIYGIYSWENPFVSYCLLFDII
jgi:hypothetical protein